MAIMKRAIAQSKRRLPLYMAVSFNGRRNGLYPLNALDGSRILVQVQVPPPDVGL